MSSPPVAPQDESSPKAVNSFRRQVAWAAAAAMGLAVGVTAVVLLTQASQETSPSLRATNSCRSAARLDTDGSLQVSTNLDLDSPLMPPPACASTTDAGTYYQMMAPARGHFQAAPGVVVVDEVNCQCVASDGAVQAQDTVTFWTSMRAPDMPYVPLEFVAAEEEQEPAPEDTENAPDPEDDLDGAAEEDGSEASPPASEDDPEDILTIVGTPTNTHCYLADPLPFDAHFQLGDSLADQTPTMDQVMDAGCDLDAAAVFYEFTANNIGSMSVGVSHTVGDDLILVSVWRGTGCDEELLCEGQDFNSITWSVNHPNERFIVAVHKLTGYFDLHVWKQWQD
jgi:hypothetical protein